MKNPSVICGKYRLLYRIGEGAMGVVWAAINLHTGREVAVKLITSAADQEQLRLRLLREARAIGQLSHRNVVEVLDAGETEDGEPYLVMPLLVGETLRQLLDRRRRLEPPLAAQIGRDIARALTAAHAASIVHRDLKPANIFLHRERGSDGVVIKVVDFGVCKRLEGDDTTLTAPDKVLGTVPYMSPEQFQPQSGIDHRTDIWSLGVVMFELLTGVKPFQGEQMDIIVSIISRDSEIPSAAQIVHYVPRGLSDIVSRCMVRDRDRRIASAAELVALLQAYAAPGDVARVYGSPIQRVPASFAGIGGRLRGREAEVPPPRSPVLSSEGADLMAADAEIYGDSSELTTGVFKEPPGVGATPRPPVSPPPLSTPPLLALPKMGAQGAPKREPHISSSLLDRLLGGIPEIAPPAPAAKADGAPADLARKEAITLATNDFEVPGVAAASREAVEPDAAAVGRDSSMIARARRTFNEWIRFRRPRTSVVAVALCTVVAGFSLAVGCRMTPPSSAMLTAVPYGAYIPMKSVLIPRTEEERAPSVAAVDPPGTANATQSPGRVEARRPLPPGMKPLPGSDKNLITTRPKAPIPESPFTERIATSPTNAKSAGEQPASSKGGVSAKAKSCRLIPSACKLGR
jgi:serine/threonine protein kinase